MRKILTIAALLGALAAYQCSAFEVNISRTAGYFTSPGGEFTIKPVVAGDSAFAAIYKNYAPEATLNGGFQTFCINRYLSVGGNPKEASTELAGVSMGTAWLYDLFATHNSVIVAAGYDYAPGAGRAASAWALQNALWILQGQAPVAPGVGDAFVAMAVAKFGAGAYLDSGGKYNVAKLVLADRDGTLRQPMLALVPDGGTTVILLGMALGALGLIRRKS